MATGSSIPPLSKAERDALAQDIDRAWDDEEPPDQASKLPSAAQHSEPPVSRSEPSAPPAAGESAKSRWPLWLAAALLVAVVVRLMSVSDAEPVEAPAQAQEVAIEPEPEPVATPREVTEPAPRAVPGAASARAMEASEPPTSPSGTPSSEEPKGAEVTVHVFPLEGQIYRKGHIIGTGAAKVKVAPNTKEVLLVLLDGYHARKVVLDGEDSVVNVGLVKKKAKSRAAVASTPSVE